MGKCNCFKACHCCCFVDSKCLLTGKKITNMDDSCENFCCIDCRKGRNKAEKLRKKQRR